MAKGWTSYENQGMLTESWRSFLSEEEQVVAGINSTEYPDSLVNILAPLIKSGAITQLQYEVLERLLLHATAEDGVILEGPNGGPREFSSNTTSALSQIVDDFNLEPTALKTLQRTLDKWARMNTVEFATGGELSGDYISASGATAARSEDLPPPEEEPTPVEVEEEPEETEPEEEPTPVEVEEEPPEVDIPTISSLYDEPPEETGTPRKPSPTAQKMYDYLLTLTRKGGNRKRWFDIARKDPAARPVQKIAPGIDEKDFEQLTRWFKKKPHQLESPPSRLNESTIKRWQLIAGVKKRVK